MATTTTPTTRMKVAPVFEIKVAVMGYVSVGKTTVLNALFRDKYGEVAMRRTTAGVDNFRISKVQTESDDDDNGKDTGSSSTEKQTWSMVVDHPRTATSTLKEITADNLTLRESNKVEEKTFDIELKEDLCEMRPDTKLVLVDIPGINEAGASNKYKDFVSDKWHTFDCVVVVMDGRHGVNTEEQINLLKLVEEKRCSIKNVPVIILCNKIDEPEDEEQQSLVQETRIAVERIFGAKKSTKKSDRGTAAADYDFIPISAGRGFIYRTASQMTLDQFQRFDKDLVERLGREVYGTSWRRLSAQKKIEMAYNVVTDPEQCREGLGISNFDKFLKVLSDTVGGEAKQLALINKQMDVATARLSPGNRLADEIRVIFDLCRGLGKPTDDLIPQFWRVFKDCEEQSFAKFTGPDQVSSLAAAMKQLTAYHELVKEAGWNDEVQVIKDQMKKMIRRQFGVLFEKSREFVDPSTATADTPWKGLPHGGWESVFRCILMVANERVCYEHFGEEIVWLESYLRLTQKKIDGGLPPKECSSCNTCDHLSNSNGVTHCHACDVYMNSTSGVGNCAYCKYKNNAIRRVFDDSAMIVVKPLLMSTSTCQNI
jgi:GTPase SAR1 family protein